MAQIIKNIKQGLVKIREFISDDHYFPANISNELSIVSINKCIELIDACLPKDVDCFGVESVLRITDEEWNAFGEIYKKLKTLYCDIRCDITLKSIAVTQKQLKELDCLIADIEKRLLSIVN